MTSSGCTNGQSPFNVSPCKSPTTAVASSISSACDDRHSMASFYDARGNLYAVITPHALRELGVAIAEGAAEAAQTRQCWTTQAITAICDWPIGQRPEGAKSHRCDGLLVGPFQERAPFDVLIVNTDGTLAERSGNGLTIFAQSLQDNAKALREETFELRVHHDHPDSPTPVPTQVEPATVDDVPGFWLDIGKPRFGPAAVGAVSPGVTPAPFNDAAAYRIQPLAELHPEWDHSVFVRVGNPHCVTLVESEEALPGFEQLHRSPLNEALTAIAFAAGEFGKGDPCPAGVNLQWATRLSSDQLVARVFERGEGPTASSGTSASAVASAAWAVGWVGAGRVQVLMPGGTAPLDLREVDGQLVQVLLFGTANPL